MMFCYCSFFFFNDTATTEIYTLSLHDALPIYAVHAEGIERIIVPQRLLQRSRGEEADHPGGDADDDRRGDRKSTRLNSSHSQISYAVFCLKKKKNNLVANPSRSIYYALYQFDK